MIKDHPYLEIWFEDECKLKQHPTLTRMWMEKQTRPVIPTLGNHFKLDIWGFVNPLTGQTFEALTHGQNSKIFCGVVKEFLKLKEKQGKLIILVLDHASWHTSKFTTKFLEKNKNQVIYTMWVPAYCGDLNIREYIWKELRRHVSHNFFYKDEKAMKKAVNNFFKLLKQNPKWVKTITTLKRLKP